ncbi:MAG: hypothetical protein ACRDSJ_23405 [Rubrobacteraceae bacterium]
MRKAFVLILLAVASFACEEEDRSASGEDTASGGGVAALSGVEAANERASEWSEDAELYAVATATPSLDAEGNSPVWLYTYVSESAGAVATFPVEDGEAGMDPEQELPEPDIDFLSENALPPADELIDSSEAVDETEEVGVVLEENPGAEVSVGLDSVSGGEPVWIFSTIRGEERVDERVPALAEGG